jgi:AraC-like DNA-binding protein
MNMAKAMSPPLKRIRQNCTIGPACRERLLIGQGLAAVAPACQMGGLSELRPPYAMDRRQGTGFHLVLGTRRGGGVLSIAGGERRLVPGELLLIPAGTPHAYRIAESSWDIAWLHLHPAATLAGFPAAWQIGADPSRIASLAALLEACLDGQGRRRSTHLLRALHHWAVEELGGAGGPHQDPLLTKLYATLADRLHAPWRIADLARLAALSPAQLHRRCVAAYGHAPLRHLALLRLELARELVLHGELGLRAIAAQVGYGDEFALSAAFKRRWGMSPLACRAQAG